MSVVVWEAAQKWYCQYSFTHFTQKFWATVQWNKYPRSAAKWIFIPLCQPQISLSYPSNICGASLPEAFRLSTSISGGYSNSSYSSAISLFSAALSCNPYFFCRFAVNAEKFRGFVGKSAFRVLQIHLICDILYKIMGIFMNKSTL